jgi:molecular chaperone HtpG
LVFETSYKGESCKTVIEWDARLLKFIINNRHDKESASEVIDKITQVSIFEENQDKHYFKVTLDNVSSSFLLDVQNVRDYLSMISPAHIHPRFILLSKIKEYISVNNIVLDTYNINVNSEEISKGYTTKIYELTGNDKKAIDEIKDVIFFQKYSEDGQLLLWGWYGIWSFSKQIPEKVNPARGFRLRKNNIQIGDEYCLVKLHKEPRGNFYYFGEVHAVHPELIPNARRDYFLENSYLEEFENYLKDHFKELYGSYHLSSKIRSAQREILKLNEIDIQIESKKNIYNSHQEKSDLAKRRQEQEEKAEKARKDLLKYSESSKGNEVKERIVNELIKDQIIPTKNSPQTATIKPKPENIDVIIKPDKAKIIFIDDNTLPRQSKEERKLIKRVFDAVDNCLADKALVENIRLKIIEKFNRGKS